VEVNVVLKRKMKVNLIPSLLTAQKEEIIKMIEESSQEIINKYQGTQVGNCVPVIDLRDDLIQKIKK
jgi:hypothetical protein